ncbi:hypothetical protein J6590_016966 [Homalodisca vitripennis]|nr:hypothetical protein J6590_016966 [Homalodisca vitripennis]
MALGVSNIKRDIGPLLAMSLASENEEELAQCLSEGHERKERGGQEHGHNTGFVHACPQLKEIGGSTYHSCRSYVALNFDAGGNQEPQLEESLAAYFSRPEESLKKGEAGS